mgnify:FL=1
MSNGSQTNLLHSFLESGENLVGGDSSFHSLKSKLVLLNAFEKPNFLYDAQKDRSINQTSYEPDVPNNTPRINLVALRNGGCFHHVFKNTLDRAEQRFYPFDFVNGQARLLTTYTGENIEPLPSFTSEPVLSSIKCLRTVAQTADAIYGALNSNYRIAVAAIHVDPQNGKIVDRHIINPARDADRL